MGAFGCRNQFLGANQAQWVQTVVEEEDFKKFVVEIEPSLLANIKAVAMDMNASYHMLVQEKLLQAQIVYDRYAEANGHRKKVSFALLADGA